MDEEKSSKKLLTIEEIIDKLEAYKDFVTKTISKMTQQYEYIDEEIALAHDDENSKNDLVRDRNLLKKDISEKERDLKEINDLIVDCQAIEIKKLMDMEIELQNIEDKLRFY